MSINYGTIETQVGNGMHNDFTGIQSLMATAQNTTDPGKLQCIQMESQMLIQHMTAMKQLGDDIAGAMKKWSEPVHPTQ